MKDQIMLNQVSDVLSACVRLFRGAGCTGSIVIPTPPPQPGHRCSISDRLDSELFILAI